MCLKVSRYGLCACFLSLVGVATDPPMCVCLCISRWGLSLINGMTFILSFIYISSICCPAMLNIAEEKRKAAPGMIFDGAQQQRVRLCRFFFSIKE